MQPPLLYVGGGILGSKNFTVTQTEMQELMSSGDPKYSFTLIDSAGNEKPLNFVDGIAVAPSEEGEYKLYASYTEYGTTYYSNGIPFIVKKPDPYWFYFGDTKTLVLKSGPDVPAGYGATVTGSGKIPNEINSWSPGSGWEAYRSEMVKAVVADEIIAPENMNYWFNNAENLASLEGFENLNTSRVTNMEYLFSGCESLDNLSGLEHWDVSKVMYMTGIFTYCSFSDVSVLADWNTGSVTIMNSLFSGCKSLDNLSGLEHWDVSKVTDMNGAFYNCSALKDISALANWKTNSVTMLLGTFCGCESLDNLSGLEHWNVSKVTNLGATFGFCSFSDVSVLADWDVSNVTTMTDYIRYGGMFKNCKNVTNWTSLEGWNVSNVQAYEGTFKNCKEPLPSWADASWQ